MRNPSVFDQETLPAKGGTINPIDLDNPEPIKKTRESKDTIERRIKNLMSILVQSPKPLPEIEAKIAVLQADLDSRQTRTHAPTFTTAYAIEWGKAQGWKLIDRERFDHRTKRHHDCAFGTDALFLTKSGRVVGVQGAGRYERLSHYERFQQRTTDLHHAHIVYLEFERGNKTPVLVEWWTDQPEAA